MNILGRGSSKWEMGQNMVHSGVNSVAGWEVAPGQAHAGRARLRIRGSILRAVRGAMWSGLRFEMMVQAAFWRRGRRGEGGGWETI